MPNAAVEELMIDRRFASVIGGVDGVWLCCCASGMALVLVSGNHRGGCSGGAVSVWGAVPAMRELGSRGGGGCGQECRRGSDAGTGNVPFPDATAFFGTPLYTYSHSHLARKGKVTWRI